MALGPHVVRKAQGELDRVLGGGCLPDFSDQEELPYISAIVKELFRWGCPVPIGVPKRMRKNDTYKGYFIPAGAIVVENIWSVKRQNVWIPISMDLRSLIRSHVGKCSAMSPSILSRRSSTRKDSSKMEKSTLPSGILRREYSGREEGAEFVTAASSDSLASTHAVLKSFVWKDLPWKIFRCANHVPQRCLYSYPLRYWCSNEREARSQFQ